MRQARFSCSLLVIVVAACGGDSKTTDPDASTNPLTDSSSTVDTPTGTSTITVSGTTTERTLTGMAIVGGATIAAYRNGDDATPVAMTTSATDGTFTLSLPASGGPLDGYLKATKTDLKDAYLYPPAPITADIAAPVNMIRQSTWDTLVSLAIGSGNQQADKGLIALLVVSGLTADSTPVADAVVTSSPASTVRYNNGLFPNGTTGTAADGLAFLFNVATDQVVVSATKGTTTYQAHGVKPRANVFTTTIITP
jgi:hypothetical protein